MVSTCLILEMKNKKDITYKKQKVMKKKRNKKKSMKEYVKEILEHYKVVKVTDGKYQLRPKSGVDPEIVQKALEEMKRKKS